MYGTLLQQAKKDAAAFMTKAGFEVEITITTPNGLISANVTGFSTGHWIVYDDTMQGKPVQAISNSVTIPEETLIAAGYPYKNSKNRIALMDHKVVRNDGASMTGTFYVNEVHPNATFGLIVMIVGTSKNSTYGAVDL